MCSVKTEFLKISKNSSEKHLCKSLFFNWRPATLLKKDFETGAFLWTLRNFWDHLFSPLGECFWRQKNRVLSGRYDPVYDPVSPDTVDELITEMYGQLPFISGNVLASSVYIILGNKRANKMYIRIYSVNRNTLSVKSEKWQSVWSTWCFNFFGLSFLNVISERGKMLLLNADAIYFHKKAPS